MASSRIKTVDERRQEVRRYWDAHPIAVDSVPFDRGSEASFDAVFANWERNMDARRLAFLDACRGKRVLEVGCGIGIDGRYLASHGANYRAVDLSRESLRLARAHFAMKGLPQCFTNASATRLPFPDECFDVVMSIGVLHHVPEMREACREVVRVLKPGGLLRVMLYNRRSYHYVLVNYLVRPLLWLLLRVPGGSWLARLSPRKFREMYDICRRHGFDAQTILSASTDTSWAGEGNFNPLSYFVRAGELEDLFGRLDWEAVYTTDLKYFPFPWIRDWVERRWGFFLQVTARRPSSS